MKQKPTFGREDNVRDKQKSLELSLTLSVSFVLNLIKNKNELIGFTKKYENCFIPSYSAIDKFIRFSSFQFFFLES